MLNKKKLVLASALAIMTGSAHAGYTFQINEKDSISFGGYIKIDTRYVNGDIAYQDFWTGGGSKLSEDASQVKMFANESRFNTKLVHGDVTGFLEIDFYGGGGNEIISNSSHPRLRHATIKYKDLLFGQTWTTFMNTSSLAETADFAGPLVAEPFVRNTMIRYSYNGFEFAIENPESFGNDQIDESPDADPSNDDLPDFIAKYTAKGDWGNVSVSGLFRSLHLTNGDTETGVGVSVAGRINTVGKDDFRFSVSTGNLGRYVGVTAATDVFNGEAEDSTSIMVAYRHFWTKDIRSTAFYGRTETDESDRERSQFGVNVFKNYTPELSFGFEAGNYDVDDLDASSFYAQFSAIYKI